MTRDLTSDLTDRLAKAFDADPTARLLQNAVTTTPVDDIALDRRVVTSIDHSVSHLLDDWTATDQKKSGRCWLFAGTNLLRVGAAKKMGVKDFEFSQNHLLFWDKFEKANHWLESILATADRDVDDRTVAHLLSDPGGGRRAVEHVRRARRQARSRAEVGDARDEELVQHPPHEPRPRRPSCARPRATCAPRPLPARAPRTSTRPRRRCWRRCTASSRIHLGTPPESFVWQWKDSDKGFHRDGSMTPHEFARGLRHRAARGLRLPRPRPARVEPVRPDVHRRVPRQRRRRPAGDLPQRRDRPDEAPREGGHRRRRAGLVRLRHRSDVAQRPRPLGRRALRLRGALRHDARPAQGRPAHPPRVADDPRHALHRRRRRRRRAAPLAGGEQLGLPRRATRASSR